MAAPEILVKVGADTNALQDAMKRVEKSLDGFKKTTDKIGKGLQNFGNKAVAAGKSLSVLSAGVTALAGGAFLLVKNTAEAGDAIAKNARQVGVATGYYQEMVFAIGQVTDFSGPELDGALSRLTRNLGEAADGSKTAIEAFEKIGISQAQIASGSINTQQAFDTYIAKMSEMKDPAIAAAISAELLGRSGANLGAQLSGAGGELSSLRADAQRLGIVLSEDALKASEVFGDQTDALAQSFEALKRKIGAELLPLFTQTLLPMLQNQIIPAIGAVVDKIAVWVRAFNDLPDGVQTAAAAITAAFAVGGPVLIAVGLVAKALGGLVLFMGPAGLIAGAVLAGIAVWATYGDAASAQLQRVLDAADTLATKMLEIIGLGEKAEQIKLGAAGGGVPGLAGGTTSFGGILSGAVGAIRGAISPGKDSGASLADGIVNGFQSKMTERIPEIDATSRIPETVFRQATETNSPSMVFHRLGTYLGDGMAAGITESSALVGEAARNMGQLAVSETENSVSGVLTAMGNLFQGSKKISAAIAVANSWLAFTEVLKDPSFIGRPFARFAAAASALASGLNAVKNIKSASASGGGGGGGGAAPAASQPQRNFYFDLQGDSFSRQSVQGLITDFQRQIDRGGRVVFG